MTNGDPVGGPQPRTSIMALLGALAAAGSGRRGCVLRVAADAITFYCGGDDGDVGSGGGGLDAGADDDGDGSADHYLRSVDAGGNGRGRTDDYFRPVRSVATGDGATGYYNDTNNNSVAAILANITTSIEPYLNGSLNHTIGVENVENLTNYIFVISIGIILGAMILTTICGKLYPIIIFKVGIIFIIFNISIISIINCLIGKIYLCIYNTCIDA